MEPTDQARGEDGYFERIERHFGLRRGGPVVLSPRDWQLVQRWRREGIPAAVVMRGINRAFDRHEASRPGSRINSLSYCRQQVQECWQEHRELAAAEGDRGAAAHEGPAAHLAAAAERCHAAAEAADEPATAQHLRDAARELEALAAGSREGAIPVREIDARARDLESELRERLPDLFEGPPGGIAALPRFSPWAG